jgi:hypothetical protein
MVSTYYVGPNERVDKVRYLATLSQWRERNPGVDNSLAPMFIYNPQTQEERHGAFPRGTYSFLIN